MHELLQLTVNVIFDAYLEYTPLLRHEILVNFFIAFASTATNIGIKKAKRDLDDFLKIQQLVSVATLSFS